MRLKLLLAKWGWIKTEASPEPIYVCYKYSNGKVCQDLSECQGGRWILKHEYSWYEMAAKGSMKDDIAPVKEWWPITQSEELLKLYKGEPNV